MWGTLSTWYGTRRGIDGVQWCSIAIRGSW